MSARAYRQLAGAIRPAQTRRVMLRGREHLVCSVVMLVGDTVITATGAGGPELVPATVLASTPEQWNGRPLVADHPTTNGGSANSPQQETFGVLFGTTFKAGKLTADAYIDVERCQELGGDALAVLTRVEAGEVVGVSVGAWVRVAERSGTHNGERYTAVWESLASDHLAMLPARVAPACSIDMGCGTRAASAAPSTFQPPAAPAIRAACGHDSRCNCQETRTMTIDPLYQTPDTYGLRAAATARATGQTPEQVRAAQLAEYRQTIENNHLRMLAEMRERRKEQEARAAAADAEAGVDIYAPPNTWRIQELQDSYREQVYGNRRNRR